VGFILAVVLMFILEYPGNFILGLMIVGWLIVMLPILFWIPAFYRSLEYVIDNDSIKGKRGVFWKKGVTVPYTKVTNIDVTQGPGQRMFNLGTIHVQTAGAGGTQGTQAELVLLGIRDFNKLKDTIVERVKGYTLTKSEGVKKEVVEESDLEIFRRMLKELIAIREVLEKKQN
jgi:hypothetical protein